MKRSDAYTILAAALALAAMNPALAQAPEPAVNTSAARPAARPPSAAPVDAPQAAPAPQDRAPAAPRRPANRAMDRVDLEASQITGNRELPRVLYIVPWRAPNAGDLEGKPVNSLLYELSKPVDRDVFRRENRYFDALAAAATTAPAGAEPPAPPPQASPEPAPSVDPVRDTSQPRTPSGN